MAIEYVGMAGNANTNPTATASTSINWTATPGNVLVACITFDNNLANRSYGSTSGTSGTMPTWYDANVSISTNSGPGVACTYAEALQSSGQASFALASGTAVWTIIILEFAGIDADRGVGVNSASVKTVSSGVTNVTQTAEAGTETQQIAVGFFHAQQDETSPAFTPGSGWTFAQTIGGVCAQYRQVTNGTSYTNDGVLGVATESHGYTATIVFLNMFRLEDRILDRSLFPKYVLQENPHAYLG